MKKFGRALCFILCFCMLVPFLASCERKPGLYNWYGGRMNVKSVLTVTVDVGEGAKAYEVPFDTYRTVFVYLKGLIASAAVNDEDGAKLVITGDKEGDAMLVSVSEQTAAVKEVTEDTLIEYYSLLALGEKYGISITEADKTAFRDAHIKKILSYVEQIDAAGTDFKGTKEEYAEELYRKSLALAGGMTPEYLEFTTYKDLLEKRLKLAVSADLDDYLAQNYCHFKQVIVTFTKGDSAAEKTAKASIDAAYAALLGGADIDNAIDEYGEADVISEIYFDGYGSVVGSSVGEAVNDITANAIRALNENGISDILTGDMDERTGYFAVFKRLPIDKEFVCGEDNIGRTMLQYPYVGATAYSPLYDRYFSTKESYRQNTVCVPISDRVYDRIAVNTLY